VFLYRIIKRGKGIKWTNGLMASCWGTNIGIIDNLICILGITQMGAKGSYNWFSIYFLYQVVNFDQCVEKTKLIGANELWVWCAGVFAQPFISSTLIYNDHNPREGGLTELRQLSQTGE
jgi:hypothetical protein